MPQVLFHDGFGQYANVADLNRRAGNLGVSGIHVDSDWGTLVTTESTRSGAKKWNPGTFGFGMTIDVDAGTVQEGIVGYRGYVVGNPSGHDMIAIHDSNGRLNIAIRHNADYSITIYRGEFPTLALVTSPINALQAGTRPFIEFKFKIANSGGMAEVRVNSQIVCTFTGDTVQTSWGSPTEDWHYVVFHGSQVQPSDIYVADATDLGDGFGAHEYIGEAQTDFHQIIGPGASDDWTPSGGSDTADVTDEMPSDQGSTFSETSTPTDQFTVEHEDLKFPGAEIVCVTDLIDASKSDSGPSVFRVLRRHAGIDYEVSPDIAPNEGEWNWFGGNPQHFLPSGAVLWTETDFNAGEIGARKTV